MRDLRSRSPARHFANSAVGQRNLNCFRTHETLSQRVETISLLARAEAVKAGGYGAAPVSDGGTLEDLVGQFGKYRKKASHREVKRGCEQPPIGRFHAKRKCLEPLGVPERNQRTCILEVRRDDD